MSKKILGQMAVAGAMSLGAVSSHAAAVAVTVPLVAGVVDSQRFEVPVTQIFDQREKQVWVVENYANTALGIQSLQALMDPDPIITAAVSVLDFGAASNFGFTWAIPIVPTVGPQTLKLTIGGSCTDNNNDGCSVTPNAASGLFADGSLDGTVFLSGGSAFSGPAGGSGSFASSIFTILVPAGPYTSLGLDLGFLASGGGDAIAFTLSVETLNAVPEPSGLALATLGLALAGAAARRRKA